MVKADLHVHTRYSHDCLTKIEDVITRCEEAGIDCIAVTDHNEIKGALLLQEKAPFKVIVGEEIRTNQGEIIGYFLTEHIKPGLSPAQTIEEIRNQGGLVCVPHPFDRLRKSKLQHAALIEVQKDIDMIEVFNARNVYAQDNHKAREFAAKNELMVSVGTDAHWYWEIGRTYLELPDFYDAESFRESLKSVSPLFTGEMNRSGLWVHAGTKSLKILKKLNARWK